MGLVILLYSNSPPQPGPIIPICDANQDDLGCPEFTNITTYAEKYGAAYSSTERDLAVKCPADGTSETFLAYKLNNRFQVLRGANPWARFQKPQDLPGSIAEILALHGKSLVEDQYEAALGFWTGDIILF
ncbi:MAG: hypothetical protein ACK5UT_00330 [Acidobacteriota bacterium]|jgi:hypothetical protein